MASPFSDYIRDPGDVERGADFDGFPAFRPPHVLPNHLEPDPPRLIFPSQTLSLRIRKLGFTRPWQRLRPDMFGHACTRTWAHIVLHAICRRPYSALILPQ